MTGEEDSIMGGQGAARGLFDGVEAETDAVPSRNAVARAFELAGSGLYTTIESITGQLKAEGVQAVDALLFDSAIRKALRQACAEARIALLRRGRAG